MTNNLGAVAGTKLEKGNHKLKDIVTFFDVDIEASAHGAMVDVNALSSVLQQMIFVLELTVVDLIKMARTPSQYFMRPQE
jgi:ABC-type cobalamin/Fe3+-siderophores transport system ATPase subunit